VGPLPPPPWRPTHGCEQCSGERHTKLKPQPNHDTTQHSPHHNTINGINNCHAHHDATQHSPHHNPPHHTTPHHTTPHHTTLLPRPAHGSDKCSAKAAYQQHSLRRSCQPSSRGGWLYGHTHGALPSLAANTPLPTIIYRWLAVWTHGARAF
jgi:hypothetical protein